jgi:hypothetical protein
MQRYDRLQCLFTKSFHMTYLKLKSLQPLFLISACILMLSGCVKDTCKQSYTYKIYRPVYLSYEDLRSSVKSSPATALRDMGKICYKPPYIFISEVNKGIHVIDNSNPSSPQNIGFINVPGNIDISVKDNILYADSYIDLVAIDISNPASATQVSRVQNVFPGRVFENGWAGDPAKGVVVDWVEGDTTLEQECSTAGPIMYFNDVFTAGFSSTTSSGGTSSGATFVSPGNGVNGSMARFTIYDHYLYCLEQSTMKLFDINVASKPSEFGSVNMAWNIETIFPYDHYLFIGTTTGVSIYDNVNPSSPVFISQFSHVTSCDPVVVQGNYAYATLRDGTNCQGFNNEVDVIDISNIYNPQLKSVFSLSHPFGLGIDGNKLFICDDNSGLKLLDCSDPANLSLLQTTTSVAAPRDVIPYQNLLLVVATDGLYQFDYSTASLQQLSFIPVAK